MNDECKVVFKEAASICVFHVGPMPSPDIDLLEDGDQIFVATIPCEAEFIHATLNVFQWLAEAFHKNAQSKTFYESVPTHFHDLEDLFVKSSIARHGTMQLNWSLEPKL